MSTSQTKADEARREEMRKVLYKDVPFGAKYIYISKTGAWVESAWRIKGESSGLIVLPNQLVWVE